MKGMNVSEKIKNVLGPYSGQIKARLFVTREDGITVFDTVQDKTTTSVAALVSGVWQASEALMSMVHHNDDIMNFRLGFDTSSKGIYLFPFALDGKRYFLGAIYTDCLNPGQLKRQVAQVKEEFHRTFGEATAVETKVASKKEVKTNKREGFLFQDISDDEIDNLFSVGGI